jgi:ethanolamine transporter
MSINDIIVYIMVFFMVLGAIDRVIGGRFGLAAQFEEGFNAMGPLALGMIGVTCLAPLLGDVITPSIGPFFRLFGADPAMAGTIILSIDTGGYALAHAMTSNADIANYSAIILGSMMGPTLAFGIPVALGIINAEDRRFLALGTMAGLIVIPIACVIGGLIAGFDTGMVLVNMIPIFIVAFLLSLGLGLIPRGMIKGFNVFSKIMIAIITVALALAIIEKLTGLTVLPGMAPLEDSYVIIGSIAIMLAGAYPMVHVITKLAKKPLSKVGKLIGINEVSVAGMIATLANSIPMFGMVKDMDSKGKLLNFAFAVCAAFALGDHLGFAAGVEPDLIFAMVACKILGGILCVVAGIVVYKVMRKKLGGDITSAPPAAEAADIKA